MERKGFFTFLSAQGPPHRRGFRVGVGGGQQQLRLMCLSMAAKN
jgi:hypothetical protein